MYSVSPRLRVHNSVKGGLLFRLSSAYEFLVPFFRTHSFWHHEQPCAIKLPFD